MCLVCHVVLHVLDITLHTFRDVGASHREIHLILPNTCLKAQQWPTLLWVYVGNLNVLGGMWSDQYSVVSTTPCHLALSHFH